MTECVAQVDQVRAVASILMVLGTAAAIGLLVDAALARPSDPPKVKRPTPYYCRIHGTTEDRCADKHDL